MMLMKILAKLAVFLACLGTAHAQDPSKPVIFPQLGHASWINSVAFSSDAKVLASGSGDHTIKLWDVASGRELRTLSGHSSDVNSVAFSPDGKLLASGSGDKTIKLWDVASGRELRSLSGHTAGVNSVAFSPDGRMLASASGFDMQSDFDFNRMLGQSSDSTISSIRLWDVASGRELRSLNGHVDVVGSVVFSPDGKVLASGDNSGTITLWDVASRRELRTLSGGSLSFAFSPDGKVLTSGSHGDGTIKLWDVASGRELRTLSGAASVGATALSPNGKVLASVDFLTIKLLDVASGRELRSLNAGAPKWVAFSPDGKVLASDSFPFAIKLWDVASGDELRTLSGADSVNAVAFSPDGKVLASGGEDIKLWDAASGRKLRTLSGGIYGADYVAFAPDGKALASSGWDNIVKLSDVASGRELRALRGHTERVISVAFSPDGKVLASGSWDKTIKLWDVAGSSHCYLPDILCRLLSYGREPRTLSGHTGWVQSVAFSPDGKVLASGSFDNTVKLWDVSSGRELRTLVGDTGSINSVAFSPDGKVLASGSYDAVKLWDVASGSELRTLSGNSRSVTFSPDGKVLLSGGSDHTITLWNVTDGRKLRTLSQHTGEIHSVAFSPDGKTLVSGSEDGTTREWDTSSGEERVQLVAFADGSFLAITPEGFFDSSSAQAEGYLNVRIGTRVFAIGSYREKFYRPDLVKLSLADGPLIRFGSIAGEKLPPIVELVDLPPSTSEPKLNITLHLTDGGGGIGLVRVFLNGSAIIQDNKPGALTRSYSVPLLDGPNELRAVAFNTDGSVQSNSATGSIAAHLPSSPRGTLHAIVVGIQDFPKRPQNNLTYSVADAQLFADTLKKYSVPLFEKLDIRLLTTAIETDKDHVVQALTAMQSAAGPNDEFVFYVASHGTIVDGEYYLITSNVTSPEPASLKAEAISRQQLAGLLANIHAPKKLVIIDTCHAQPVGDALQQALQGGGMTDSTATTILSRQIGSTVLAAATTDQEALEGYKDHGLFTRVLADGLMSDEDADKDGIVSTFLLAHYLGVKVPPLAKNLYQHDQTPTVQISGQEFPIAKVK